MTVLLALASMLPPTLPVVGSTTRRVTPSCPAGGRGGGSSKELA